MKTLILFIALCLFTLPSTAAPLVFKITRDVDSPEKFAELATVDTAKYRDLRIYIEGSKPSFNLLVAAVEEKEQLILLARPVNLFHENFLFNLPPAKTRVLVRGTGTFKLFIWAS